MKQGRCSGAPATRDRFNRNRPLPGHIMRRQERLDAHVSFPRENVFVHQYFCPDFADRVTYTNVDAKVGFLAVYAGATDAASKTPLDRVKAAGKFRGANIRRMAVVVTIRSNQSRAGHAAEATEMTEGTVLNGETEQRRKR
jgi:hypothetical protein